MFVPAVLKLITEPAENLFRVSGCFFISSGEGKSVTENFKFTLLDYLLFGWPVMTHSVLIR